MRIPSLRTLLIPTLAVVLLGCSDASPPAEAPPAPLAARCGGEGDAAARLFGRPNANTGLDDARCGDACACDGGAWRSPEYTQAQLDALTARTLLDPPAELRDDPYARTPQPAPQPDKVCAVVPVPEGAGGYRLDTFNSAEAAHQAGARVTHSGACGLCSSLQDLSVYIARGDLTDPVRRCGISGITHGHEGTVRCIQELGFTLPCAQIWAYNTTHTREACGSVCFALLGEPYHSADGAPNACIQCDEDQSGPVFKAVAGRTRRNSGLPTALCRPCQDVFRVTHEAYP